ncbi:MAG: cytochrome c [Caldilineaceae bacterium]
MAACGRSSSNSNSDTGATAAPTVAPTMPAANFAAVSQSAGVITETLVVSDTENNTSTSDLERGAAAYTKNKCGDCHGANGEGVADKGNVIASTTLPFEDFETVLRTGGGLGNEHIFGRSAISPGGMTALYDYVKSLK